MDKVFFPQMLYCCIFPSQLQGHAAFPFTDRYPKLPQNLKQKVGMSILGILSWMTVVKECS